MSVNYKRTIIQVPLEDVPAFEEYSNRYGLSFSASIIMLAKKALENENMIALVPTMLNYLSTENISLFQDNKKKINKSCKKKK